MLPPPPSASRPRNESIGATLTSYRNRPSVAIRNESLIEDESSSLNQFFFNAVKRPEVSTAIGNLVKKPSFQKTVINAAKDTRVQSVVQNSKVQNAALSFITSPLSTQYGSKAPTTSKTLNVEKFESRSITQNIAPFCNVSASNELKTIYPLLSQCDSFKFLPKSAAASSIQKSESESLFSWSSNPPSLLNDPYAYRPKKRAPSRPPPPKVFSRSNSSIFSLNTQQLESPSLATNEPHAIVRYPYKAANPDELSCEPNDCVLLKREVDEHWIYATNTRTGGSGIVPLLFLLIKVPLAPTQRNTGDVGLLPIELESDILCGIGTRNRQMFAQCVGAKALYDYDTNVEGDLKFKANDTIVVLSKLNAEWLRGECKKKSGIFPLSYVKLENPSDLDNLVDESKTTKTRSISDVLEKGLSALSLSANNAVTITAAFDYQSNTEGDLEFCANDVIEVVQRHLGNQWVTGRLQRTGEVGLVPLTYMHPSNF